MTTSTFTSAATKINKIKLLHLVFFCFYLAIMTAQKTSVNNPVKTRIFEVNTGSVTCNSAVIGFQILEQAGRTIQVLWSTDKIHWSSVSVSDRRTFARIVNILPNTRYFYKLYTVQDKTVTSFSPTFSFFTPSVKNQQNWDLALSH